MTKEAMDSTQAMRFEMCEHLRDLKWREVDAVVPGETAFLSPGDSVSFIMAAIGTYWSFGYDDTKQADVCYKTFAEGDTWIEFERAFLLAQAIEEERPAFQDQLIGKWWDSWKSGTALVMWFQSKALRLPAAARHSTELGCDAWRALTGHERDTIIKEVLKGVTK